MGTEDPPGGQEPPSKPLRLKIRTNRGVLFVEPSGEIVGLWRLCERELRTAQQLQKAAKVSRVTMYRWRKTEGFPKPVLTYRGQGYPLELWSRTEVEAWRAARKSRLGD